MTKSTAPYEYDLVGDTMDLLALYGQRFPSEVGSLEPLWQLLRDHGLEAFSRSNMAGHVTTSGLVYDPKSALVLMIHHRTLNRWLQPGGHHEGLAPLHASAAREVEEETGVTVTLPPNSSPSNYLLDIDIHDIPSNDKKGESAHAHHDFLYLFEADATQPLNPQWTEVSGASWMPRENLTKLESPRLNRVRDKLLERASLA